MSRRHAPAYPLVDRVSRVIAIDETSLTISARSPTFMLQPVELREVSQRFADEIADMRRFLSRADVAIGTAQATRSLTARVTEDRGFHRDFMSHIWVLLDEKGSGIRHADLLAIVAIAAAGIQGAAHTEEHDAHVLLRFLMEAKHAFDGSDTRQETIPARIVTSDANEVESRASTQAAAEAFASQRRSLPKLTGAPDGDRPSALLEDTAVAAEPTKTNRRRYVLSGVCGVVALLLLSYFLLHHNSEQPVSQVEMAGAAPLPDRPAATLPQSAAANDASVARLRAKIPPETFLRSRPATPRSASPAFTLSPTAKPSPSVMVPAQGQSAMARWDTAPAVTGLTRPDANSPATLSGNSLTAARPTERILGSTVKAARTGPVALVPTPADTLSRRLDSPTLPAYILDPDEANRRKYPRLLRRHASDAHGDSEGDPVLSAELRAPDLSPSTSPSRNTGSGTTIHGVVRSTCLGMMAGNLVFGPTPAYPSSAAAARVQGTVKIQATVDRDGTVNAARVISGPPLLRDVALDAVQRWRYKPYMAGGKPSPTGTMAIVEFELQ